MPYAMSMQVILPDEALPAKLIVNPELPMTDDEYFEFCQANPDTRFERTAKGEITIVPPAGIESGYHDLEIAGELRTWAKKNGRGKGFGPSAGFILPSGAAYSPAAPWG